MKITLRKGSPNPKVVELNDIQIPDLWHVAQMPELKGYTLGDKPLREVVIEAWHLAHDLLDALREIAASCRKCGSPVNADGFCPDETCPYSDHKQDEDINQK